MKTGTIGEGILPGQAKFLVRQAQAMARIAYRTKLVRLADAMWGPRRLTVLSYHRIVDHSHPLFELSPAGAVTPDEFERQLRFVTKNFNVIDLPTLRAFVEGEMPLPDRAVLITFDDGYLDTYTNAFPLLRKHGLPAVVFLITGFVGRRELPWWDECSHYLHSTRLAGASMPLIGYRPLDSPARRAKARDQLIRRLKEVPERRRREVMALLPEALEVRLTVADIPAFMSWKQILEIASYGVVPQPHTVSHPILTRINSEEVGYQLSESARQLERAVGIDPVAFAYPNGGRSDYSREIVQAVKDAGYACAFSMLAGPMRMREVAARPYEIRRCYVTHWDNVETLALKMAYPISLVT